MIYLKWLRIMMLNLFGFISAPVVFPIAYLLRRFKIVRNKLLWIYFDDEDGFGWNVDWWAKTNNYKENFWTAYKWCAIRNPAWNLHTLSQLNKKISEYVFLSPRGILQKDGKVLEPKINITGVLKYIDKNNEYMDNKGEYLSLKYSIIGSQYVEFYNNRTLETYWRYSYANKLIDNVWVELQMGYTTRATFRLKIKNITKIR